MWSNLTKKRYAGRHRDAVDNVVEGRRGDGGRGRVLEDLRRCQVSPRPCLRVSVSDFRFRVSGFRFRVSGLGFRVSGFRFRVSVFGFRVGGSGLRVGVWGGAWHPGLGIDHADVGLVARLLLLLPLQV